MKFINYLTSIDGVAVFPVVSFIIFFSFFVGVAWYVFKSDKDHLSYMKNIPFEGENEK